MKDDDEENIEDVPEEPKVDHLDLCRGGESALYGLEEGDEDEQGGDGAREQKLYILFSCGAEHKRNRVIL